MKQIIAWILIFLIAGGFMTFVIREMILDEELRTAVFIGIDLFAVFLILVFAISIVTGN